jgi:phosphoglycolate phosphatase-like HAD superfamily hydrolase
MSTDKTLADVQPGGAVSLLDQAERARFEAWAKSQNYDMHRSAGGPTFVVGEYTSELTAGAWEAWQYLSAQPSPSGQDALELLIARWRADAAEAATSDNTLCQKIANCTMRHAAELAAALAARQPVEFERAVPTRRRESAVELLLQLGFVWNNQRWEDRRQPVGQEPVAQSTIVF